MDIPAAIRANLSCLNWTLGDLSAKSKIPYGTLVKRMQGRSEFRIKDIEKIAKTFGITSLRLLETADEASQIIAHAEQAEKQEERRKPVNKTIIPFTYEGNAIRMIEDNGTALFCGRDVATALGYQDTKNAIKLHCRGVAKYHPIVDSLGRTQQTRFITEPDVYRLITSSKLPTAQKFERWIFEEVLPSIRCTRQVRPRREIGLRRCLNLALLRFFLGRKVKKHVLHSCSGRC